MKKVFLTMLLIWSMMTCFPSIVFSQKKDFSKVNELSGVEVSSFSNVLVRKAINHIPINYGDRPYLMNGALRIYNIIRDSDYFFKGDAIVQVYIPKYITGHNTDPKVRIIDNKTSVYYGPHFSPSKQSINYVSGYSSTYDIIYLQPNFLSVRNMKKFQYNLKEKSLYKGRLTYKIDFSNKDSNRIFSTLWIDSLTLAFTKIQYKAYNVETMWARKIDSTEISSEYEITHQKWNLKSSHRIAYHANMKGSVYTVDFVKTAIDTINVKPFGYGEIVQHRDRNNTQPDKNVDSSAQEIWTSLEKDGLIHYFTPPTETTDKSEQKQFTSSKQQKKTSLIDFLNGNLRYNIYFTQMPVTIQGNPYSTDHIARYGLGSSLQLRLHNDIWIGFDQSSNGISRFFKKDKAKLNLTSLDLYAHYEWKLNSNHRPIYLSPIVGCNYTSAKLENVGFSQKFHNIMIGVTPALELSHKLNVFTASKFYIRTTKNSTWITPKTLTLDVGISYKL